MAGSSVVALDEALLGALDEALLGALDDELLGSEALAPPLAEPEVLGCALELLELELESLGALAPPEAKPDFVLSAVDELDELFSASLEPEPPAVMPTDVLDEPEPGCAEVVPEGAAELLEDEPGVDEAPPVLELEEPGADEVRSGPLSQAARPKASAIATASVESFMCPPWLGYKGMQQIKECSKSRARPKPLNAKVPHRAR